MKLLAPCSTVAHQWGGGYAVTSVISNRPFVPKFQKQAIDFIEFFLKTWFFELTLYYLPCGRSSGLAQGLWRPAYITLQNDSK
jgi:hypothetical protein